MKKLSFVFILILIVTFLSSSIITEWNFDNSTLTPSLGTGSLSLVGGMTHDTFNTGFPGSPSIGWSVTSFPVQGTNNKSAGIYIEASSQGFGDIQLSWNIRHSNKSPKRAVLFYTLDKTDVNPVWIEAATYDASAGDSWFSWVFDGTGVVGMANNEDLAFKIVAAFSDSENSVYMPSNATSNYGTDGKWRWDNIVLSGNALVPHLVIDAELQPFYANVGAFSQFQTYTVSAVNLTGNLLVQAPTHFMIRLFGDTTFSSSLDLIPRNSAINKTIEIVYHPSLSGIHEGSINHSGGGITAQQLSITGSTTKPEPSQYPDSFAASAVTYYQAGLNWVDSSGLIIPDGYLIKGSKVSAEEISDPIDGVVEEDKKLTKNVAHGTQSVLVFELNEEHTYFFKIFPYTNSGTAINYKTDMMPPLLSLTTTSGPIGSELNPGDIAFVEYATDSPDRFSFVLLRDVLENTKIYFTDKAWTGTAFASGEEIYEWRGVGRSFLAGEVIHIVQDELYPNEGIYNPNFEGFSNDGDQIIAYQGYVTEPTFLAAFSSTGWIDSGTTTNNTSYLPYPLVLGETALGFPTEVDNGVYNGTTTGTKAGLLASINNPGNWTRAGSLANIIFPEWNFTILPHLQCPNPSIVLIDENTIRLAWDNMEAADYYLVYSSINPDAEFPEQWNLICSDCNETQFDIDIANQEVDRQFFRIIAHLP